MALLGSLVSAVLRVALFFRYAPGVPGLQFEQVIPWVSSSIFRLSYHVGVEGIAAGMLLVTGLVGFAAVAVSWDVERQTKLNYVLLLTISGGALGAFASVDLFFFYFFT